MLLYIWFRFEWQFGVGAFQTVYEVAFGQDADEGAVGVHDHQGADLFLLHQQHRLSDGRVDGNRYQPVFLFFEDVFDFEHYNTWSTAVAIDLVERLRLLVARQVQPYIRFIY